MTADGVVDNQDNNALINTRFYGLFDMRASGRVSSEGKLDLTSDHVTRWLVDSGAFVRYISRRTPPPPGLMTRLEEHQISTRKHIIS